MGARTIQLLQVDIEGAEYDLIANYPALFQRVERLMMEIHTASPERTRELNAALAAAGLRPFGRTLDHAGFQLAMFQRE